MYIQPETIVEQYKLSVSQITKGRGTYICKSEECLNKAIKNKRIARTLEMEIEECIYENLRKSINGGEIIG